MRDRPDYFPESLSPPYSEGDLVLSVCDSIIGVQDNLDLSVSA